jgi:hypothetical protein
MSPLLRVVLLAVCLGIGGGVGRLAVRAIAENVTAMRSWKRVQGWPHGEGGENGWVWKKNGATLRVFPSPDLDAMRAIESYGAYPDRPDLKAQFDAAFPVAEVTTGLGIPSSLSLIPLFVDPADPQRVKTAGSARWMFTSPPPPLEGGIALRNPPSYWKSALFWSLLGVALCVLSLHPEGGISRTKVISGALVGALFAISVWISAWRDATLRITANDHGVRLISITGWRDVRWEEVKGFQLQSIFTTYYSKFRLCKAKTGVTVMSRDVPIKY